MAGQRSLVLLEAVIEGHKFWGELEEHTPTVVEKKTEDAKGGRFASKKITTGATLSNATLKLKGATVAAVQNYGLMAGSLSQIDVKASYADEDGNAIAESWSYTGEIIKIDDGGRSTQAVPETSIEIAPTVFKNLEDGKIKYDINLDTQKLDFGKGDIMQKHRSNIGRG